MEKKLSGYIHFYLGCEILITDIDGQSFKDKVESVINNNQGQGFSIYELGDCYFKNSDEYYQDARLLLRLLSDMTEGEALEYARITRPETEKIKIEEDGQILSYHDPKDGSFYKWLSHRTYSASAPEFAWLLSKGFDLFGLIPAGLALNKSHIKQ